MLQEESHPCFRGDRWPARGHSGLESLSGEGRPGCGRAGGGGGRDYRPPEGNDAWSRGAGQAGASPPGPPYELRKASWRRKALSAALDWSAGCRHAPHWPQQMPSRRSMDVQGRPSGGAPSRAGGENQTPAPVPCFRSLLPGLRLDLGPRATLPLPGRRRGRGSPISSNTFPSRWIFHKPCPTSVGSRCLVKCFPVGSVRVQWKALPSGACGEESACSVGAEEARV